MSNAIRRPQIAIVGAIALGLLAGAIGQRQPSTALLLCVGIVAIVGLAMLGDRAFPWFIVVVAVAPWYPLAATEASQQVVKQKVLCAAVAGAVLAPWLWSLAFGSRRTKPNRFALLMGVLFAGFTVLIYETLGSVSMMIDPQIVGFLFLSVAFLCGRRFVDPRGWPAAAFFGFAVLALLGLNAYLSSPGNRVGYFTGYPITYGALIVGLLPATLLFAVRRSRLLAGAVVAGGAALLILSESRSSWVAVAVLLIIVVLVQARRGNVRTLAAVAVSALIVVGLVLGTGSLHKIVEQKLSSKVTSSQSFTHRAWSYGYALEQIAQRPLLGAGAPGFAGKEASDRTSIGAIDNGYLSISVDMGLLGLAGALVPILVALYVLLRCLYMGLAPPLELSLALGVIGIAVVTAFYDSFYWAQLDLLLGAMGGVLSVRVHRIGADGTAVRRGATLRLLAGR
ncbi:MAG: O-antigen ligase family protein [Solirubrobacteraceae bacterium]